jgi:cell wall-associated NlpC family hydrolase
MRVLLATAAAVLLVASPAAAATGTWDRRDQHSVIEAGVMAPLDDGQFHGERPVAGNQLPGALHALADRLGVARVPVPTGSVTLAGFDRLVVTQLGLADVAQAVQAQARSAGLAPPPRFGTEVVARLLGLRTNHPASQDGLELLPGDPATRAEAAYSAAQILRFPSWQLPSLQALGDAFSLPTLSTWQKRILDAAVARIGMPYVWGGTSDGPETDFGVSARGGYDCSGFVWRVYKLTKYSGEGNLASVIRGRTTYVMSAEVPKSELIGFADLQPADLVFFGAHGARSKPSEVDHVGIYIGNGWFINSSDYGVALAQLTGWNRSHFAWGRRPLAEAGLTG